MLRRKHPGGQLGNGVGASIGSDHSSSSRNTSNPKSKSLARTSRANASGSRAPSEPTSQAIPFLRVGVFVFVALVFFLMFATIATIAGPNNGKNGSFVGSSRMEEMLRGATTKGGRKISPSKKEKVRPPRHPDADKHDHSEFDVHPQPQRLPPVNDGRDADGAANVDKGRTNSLSASEAMKLQPSFWVDSERKLKAELTKLRERQERGLDLGAKTLTRYLGEDVKAWATKGEEEEWSEIVKKKKAQMREQEMEERKKRKEDGTNIGKARKTVDFVDGDHMLEKGLGQVVNEVISAVSEGEGFEMVDTNVDEEDFLAKDEKEEIFGKKGKNDASTEVIEKYFASPMDAVYSSEGKHLEALVLLEPFIGKHRPSKDAVFAFAEGYDLSIYLCFVESLRQTGFDGDIVLSVSSQKNLKPGVEEYLRSVENIVLYTVEWTCFDGEGNITHETKEGIRHCQMNDFYGLHDINNPDEQPLSVSDPREARPVATARYELYWLWATKYESHSWIMLIDSRDTYFQLDPFQTVDRAGQKEERDGTLYFFAENSEVTNLGQSSFNRGWLNKAYGIDAVSQFLENPVICSGSTMGEQVAIETYLRAMVAEFDETKCKAKGCDQGFHNYLHYSHKLEGAKGIGSIEVHRQGDGIINNVGVMRTKPLSEWGVFDKETEYVMNWDKKISPVVHQFDRDDELNMVIKARKKEFSIQWKG